MGNNYDRDLADHGKQQVKKKLQPKPAVLKLPVSNNLQKPKKPVSRPRKTGPGRAAP